MVGPVLYQEMLLGARRNRAYFFRWCYAGWILLQLFGMLLGYLGDALLSKGRFDPAAFADFARAYLETLVTQNYLMMLLVTPVLAAGAITDEKWRGTLQYLLLSELFSWEILVGKLIGRLYQVFLILLTPLPLICFLGAFGGLDLPMLLALGISFIAMAFAIGAMSLLASVVSRHTRDAVLGLYAALAIFYLGGAALHRLLAGYALGPSSSWLTGLDALLQCLHPLHPMGAGWALDDPSERNRRLAISVAAWGLVGLVSLALATLWLRGSYLRYLEQTTKRRWGGVVAVVACGWSAVGLMGLAVYLVATGHIMPYLDGTSGRPWFSALLLSLLGWNGLALAPLLSAILLLTLTGRSRCFLDRLHNVLAKNWLTRRARIGGDPLRWKERHVEGIAPLAALRALPRWLGAMLVILATSASSIWILSQQLEWPHTVGSVIKMGLAGDVEGLLTIYQSMTRSDSGFFYQGMGVMFLAGLVVAIRCSGAVTGEREKNTWEALLLTPLETRQLIRGKLWGIIGASMPYLTAYAGPACALSLIGGVGPLMWTVVWLGVTLLAMAFVGAAGLWCSVRAKTSWRSLLGTLGIAYVGGFVLYCLSSTVMFVVAALVFLVLTMIKNGLGLGGKLGFVDFFDIFSLLMCAALAGIFAFMAWRFVASAEYRIGILERTKHWRNEPKRRRRSRNL